MSKKSEKTTEPEQSNLEAILSKAQEEKIILLSEKLVMESTVEKLRSQYEKTFGVAPSQSAGKDRLARKIATFVVSGQSDSLETIPATSEAAPGPVEGSVAATVQPTVADEKSAVAALGKVKESFDEVERLVEEKRAKTAELRRQISKSREAIQAVITDDSVDAVKRVALLEGHWRMLCRTEEKRTALVSELNEQIKAAKGTVKTVLNSVRQIPLPLGVE